MVHTKSETTCICQASNWNLLAASPNLVGATASQAQGEQAVTGETRTFIIESAKQALAFCILRALKRLETGRRGDFLTDGLHSALILQFAPANNVARSSSKLQGYWQAAKGMTISAISVHRKRNFLMLFGRSLRPTEIAVRVRRRVIAELCRTPVVSPKICTVNYRRA